MGFVCGFAEIGEVLCRQQVGWRVWLGVDQAYDALVEVRPDDRIDLLMVGGNLPVDIYSDSRKTCYMIYPEPPASKTAVRRAGRRIAEGTASSDDYSVVDQWRSSHGYVINTFQAWIKKHIGKQNFEIEFAQRLKRRNTVVDKLQRRHSDGSLLISDVTSMHDFAGCRMIFDSIEDLQKFRAYMHSNDVMRNVYHELKHSPDKYDYVESPKITGYRGIHDVYRHIPRSHRRTSSVKRPWDGLAVEIQYRTRAQHAWATAVEISDIIDGERTKFNLSESDRGKFFALASEIIARKHEGFTRAFPTRKTTELSSELQSLENDLGVMQRLEALRQFEDEDKLQTHNVLNIYRDVDEQLKLDVLAFPTAAEAIKHAGELESDSVSLNAVYVRADNPRQLRSAYRNYFNDPIDFVQLLRDEADLVSEVAGKTA